MAKELGGVLRNQSGTALIIALLMIIILTLIGVASIFTSTFEVKLSGNKRGATDAFFAADSGVQVVISKVENFNLPGGFVDNKYNPFSDPSHPNPTNAKVTINHDVTQKGSPRGLGISAVNFDFEHFRIESSGQDQTELNLNKSTCAIEEKTVRLVPTLQGGY